MLRTLLSALLSIFISVYTNLQSDTCNRRRFFYKAKQLVHLLIYSKKPVLDTYITRWQGHDDLLKASNMHAHTQTENPCQLDAANAWFGLATVTWRTTGCLQHQLASE